MAENYNIKFTGAETDEILQSAKDVKEANLTTLNDISGFVAINKEGNAIGMMSKEQVASVVGGLLRNSLFPQSGRITDCNNAKSNGIYSINGTTGNCPISFGLLIVYNESSTNYLVQLAVQTWGGLFYFRSRTESEEVWSDWYKITSSLA